MTTPATNGPRKGGTGSVFLLVVISIFMPLIANAALAALRYMRWIDWGTDPTEVEMWIRWLASFGVSLVFQALAIRVMYEDDKIDYKTTTMVLMVAAYFVGLSLFNPGVMTFALNLMQNMTVAP